MRALSLFAVIGVLVSLPFFAAAAPAAPPPPTLHQDAFYAPAPAAALAADARGPSQYLAGTVAVRVVLPESNGSAEPSQEDWTPAQIEAVQAGVEAALEWWQNQLPLARLNFVVRYQVVPTAFEPTRSTLAGEGRWISDVLAQLGFRSGSYFDQAYAAAYAMRDEVDADWATTIFVANSANGNGYFADGYFAYAYINGPFMVLTSDVGGYGSRALAPIAAHEFGHIFGALDQYQVAQVPCDRTSGYLNSPTSNSQYGDCGSNYPSIMLEPLSAYGHRQIDPSALAQVGYRDSDGDGTIDPLDTIPALRLSGSLDAELGVRPRLSGNTEDLAFPSPYQPSVSINHIHAIEYRVNGGAWQSVPSADGAFDAASEYFDMELPLYDGEYTLELRARNSADMLSQPLVRQVRVERIGPQPDYAVTALGRGGNGLLALQLHAPDDTQAVQISRDPLFRGAPWLPFSPQQQIADPQTNGILVAYVRFRDSAGRESLAYPVTIDLGGQTIFLPWLAQEP